MNNNKIIKGICISLVVLVLAVALNTVNVFASGFAVHEVTSDLERVRAHFPSIAREVDKLKQAHPNWNFQFINTGYTFDDVTNVQFGAKRGLVNSLAPINLIESWGGKNYSQAWVDPERAHLGFDSSIAEKRWQAPSLQAVRYLMDPRTYLNENDVFTFLALSGNASKFDEGTSIELARRLLAGTQNESRAREVYEVSKEVDIDLLELVSKLKQEGGLEPAYGINAYNPLNIGATGSNVVINGLNYAKDQGWTTFKKGLAGGAKQIKDYYIARSQDTKYFMKFNVVNGTFYHQYMQNITAPLTEGKTVKRGYMNVDPNLNGSYTFKIPLYYSIPAKQSPRPDHDNSYNATVRVDGGLNIRSNPTSGSDKVGFLNYGQMFQVIEKVENTSRYQWFKIRVGNTYGYCAQYYKETPNDKYFDIIQQEPEQTGTEGDKNSVESNQTAPKYVYIEDSKATYPIYAVTTLSMPLRVRDGATIYGTNTIATLQDDTIIKVLGFERAADGFDWYKIEVNGKVGYSAKNPTNSPKDVNFKFILYGGLPKPEEEKPKPEPKPEPEKKPEVPEEKPNVEEQTKPLPEDNKDQGKDKDKEKDPEKDKESQEPQKDKEDQKDPNKIYIAKDQKDKVVVEDEYIYIERTADTKQLLKDNKLKVVDKKMQEAKIATGNKMIFTMQKPENGKTEKEYKIIMKGDVNKDGKVTLIDALDVIRFLNDDKTLELDQKLAAYTNMQLRKEQLEKVWKQWQDQDPQSKELTIANASNILYLVKEDAKLQEQQNKANKQN